MAETVKIEIPIEAVDKTEAGIKSATERLTAFERSLARTESRMERLGRGSNKISLDVEDNAGDKIDAVADKSERVNGMSSNVSVEADDAVTQVLNSVADYVEMLDGSTSSVEINAEDAATVVMDDVGDNLSALHGDAAIVDVVANDTATQMIAASEAALEQFAGSSGTADIAVNDNASPVVEAAGDELEAFSGSSGAADIGVNDNASNIIDSVRDKLSAIGGYAVSAVVGAIDTASAIIDSVKDKASAWAGTVYNATVGVVDAATAPMQGIMDMIQNPLTQAGAMLGVSVGLNDTVNTYKGFESMMSQVSAISGATGSDLEALTAKAKEMGATTKFTATDSAEAFNYMAMAGWKTNDMINGISGIMNLAAASGENLGTTSDIVTDALTAFGLKASDSTHFADVMAQASANANTNVAMLGESFKYVAPVAGAMNYTIEDTSLALGLMANASVKGSMAGTALKTSLANMAAPTDKMAEAMEQYGISLIDEEGNMKSLGKVIENLRSNLGGLSETEQTAAASTIFGKEAMAGMLAIINASEEDYIKLSEVIYDADGAAQRMSDTMLDNLEGSLTLMQSAIEGVQNSFGERLTPYLRGLAEMITDQMPTVEAGLNQFMDMVDSKAEDMKLAIGNMTSSDEWKNADLVGKVNIAWDKVIAEPFTRWVGSKGKHMISKGLSSLFSEAANILPGGKEAGLTSWLSAGVIAKGGLAAVEGVKKLTDALGEFSPVAGKAGIAAAAVTAAVAAIAVAVDNYNQQKISDNLAEHFGTIELSTDKVKELAGLIVPVEVTAELEFANVYFNEGAELKEDAEKALENINYLNWKVRNVTATLSNEDGEAMLENLDTFVTSITDAIEKEEYAAELTVKATIGDGSESGAIIETMQGWFAEDSAALENLSASVTNMVQGAIEEGTYDVNTATAASILQAKMMDMVNGAKQAELQGRLDWMTLTSSGAALDSDSWAAVVEQVGTYQQELINAEAESYQSMFTYIEQAVHNDPSRQGEADAIKKILTSAYNELGTGSLLTGWNWMYGSLSEVYSSDFGSIEDSYQSSMSGWQENLQSFGFDGFAMRLENYASGLGSGLDNVTKGALKDRYETMIPTIEDLQDVIDEANKNGEAVSEAVMEAYNQAMQLGAATGDSEATAAVMAQMVAEEFGDKESFMSALEESGLNFSDFSEELQAAFDRAFVETVEGTDYHALTNALAEAMSGEDVDWSAVQKLLNEAGYEVDLSEVPVTATGEPDISEIARNLEGLNYVGTTTLDGGEVAVQYTVSEGETVSGILEQYGIVWSKVEEQLREANPEISDFDLIYPTQTINIPEAVLELANVDTSGIEEAVDESMESAANNSGSVETETDITVGAGEVDPSEAYATAQEETQERFDENMNAEGTVDSTLKKGSDNIDDVYNEVGSEVQGKFDSPYSASATVNVTLDWHITNPTAHISVATNSETAHATIGSIGYAAGGEVGINGPELSWVGEEGLEYIIPTVPGRRQRGIELWKEAGRTLGVLDSYGEISAHANGGVVGAGNVLVPQDAEWTSEKEDEGIWTVTGRPVKQESSEDSSDGENMSVSLNAMPNNSGEGGGNTFEVNVTMNPVIKIEGGGMDEERIFEVLQGRIREMADDLGDEIAERMSKIFANMPMIQEA